MVGVQTLLESFQRSIETNQVTVTTEELAGNESHDIRLDENDPKIDTIEFRPSDTGPPSEGILYIIRPLVNSGSSDSDISIYESEERNDIDEVIRIEDLSVSDGVSTFQPGSGTGVPFENQEDEEEWYLTITENSGNDSVYTIRLRWFDVT